MIEAGVPAAETAINNFVKHTSVDPRLKIKLTADSNEVRPIPRRSAENIKDQTSFMLHKYLQERGYNNSEEYFKDHPSEKYIKLPYTSG